MAVLRLMANDGTGRALQTFPLAGNDLVVGRAPDAHISIEEPSMSRHHARLVWANGAWMVVELVSTNGVLVGGQRVASHVLRDGDRIRLGNIELEFRETDPREAQTVLAGGQAAADLIQQVQAARQASQPPPAYPPTPAQPQPAHPSPSAPIPPSRPPSQLDSGPGAGLAIAASILVLAAGGAGAWWYLSGRAQDTKLDQQADRPAEKPAPEKPPAPVDPVTTIAFKGERVSVEVPDGPTVTLEEGTFEAGTVVRIERLRSSVVPQMEGMRIVSPVWQIDAGGQQPRRDIGFEYVIPDKPKLKSDESLVAVRTEGTKLHGYPTDYDPETGRARARIHHLTPIHFIIGGAVIIGSYVHWVKVKDDEDTDDYHEKYVTKEGFKIYYEKTGDHAPSREQELVGGHPRYVIRIGDALDKSIRTFRTDSAFSSFPKPSRENLPNIFVKNTGASASTGTFAYTSGSGYSIVFHNGLGDRRIAATAPHEVFHVMQTDAIGFHDNAKEKLWSEMSAEWAAFVAAPGEAGPEIAETVTSAPGFVGEGMHANLAMNAQYAAGELAIFLEGKCAGLMKGLYSSSGTLNPTFTHSLWYASTSGQMKKTCPSVDLADALAEYYVRFFFKGGLGTGRTPTCQNRKALTDGKPYRSLSNSRAAASAECDQIMAAGTLVPGPFVLTASAGGPGLKLYVTELGRPGQPTGVPPPGGSELMGVEVLSTSEKIFMLEEFGGATHRASFDQVKILLTNPTEQAGGTISCTFWVVQPPTSVSATYQKGSRSTDDHVGVSWDPSKLPEASGSSGALQSYRVLQKTSSGVQELATVDADTTSARVSAKKIAWERRTAQIVVRTVDRFKNESRDSTPVTVTKPAEPKPRPKPKPVDPPNPCLTNPHHPSCQE